MFQLAQFVYEDMDPKLWDKQDVYTEAFMLACFQQFNKKLKNLREDLEKVKILISMDVHSIDDIKEHWRELKYAKFSICKGSVNLQVFLNLITERYSKTEKIGESTTRAVGRQCKKKGITLNLKKLNKMVTTLWRKTKDAHPKLSVKMDVVEDMVHSQMEYDDESSSEGEEEEVSPRTDWHVVRGYRYDGGPTSLWWDLFVAVCGIGLYSYLIWLVS